MAAAGREVKTIQTVYHRSGHCALCLGRGRRADIPPDSLAGKKVRPYAIVSAEEGRSGPNLNPLRCP